MPIEIVDMVKKAGEGKRQVIFNTNTFSRLGACLPQARRRRRHALPQRRPNLLRHRR